MYGFTNETAGSKRKERAFEAERLEVALPPELLREEFPECQVLEQLAAANAELDRRMAQSLQLWSGYFGARREGGAGAVPRTLRLAIYNTYAKQEGRYRLDSADPPSWTLRIEGRVLADERDAPNAAPIKFSQFVRHVCVQMPGGDAGSFVEWDSVRHGATAPEADGFELTRPGNREVRLKVMLQVSYPVQLYRLAPLLAQLLGGVEVETRDQVLRGLYLYTQQHKLPTDYETGKFVADADLKRLFGVATFSLEDVPRLIKPLLNPVPPFELDYTVKLSGTPQESMQCWDVVVQEPATPVSIPSLVTTRIAQNDRQVVAAMEEVAAAARHHRALAALASDPAGFVHSMVRSNARDAQFLQACESLESDDLLRNPYLDDAVRQYLLSKRLKKQEAEK